MAPAGMDAAPSPKIASAAQPMDARERRVAAARTNKGFTKNIIRFSNSVIRSRKGGTRCRRRGGKRFQAVRFWAREVL
ncbi:MAG TPA: hypothetical protein VNF28_00455 [Candidatus Binataceae bacterium]|nr:hypothetical protein [Candidatus Binataceae bacterium]